jgi:hypothetical protein
MSIFFTKISRLLSQLNMMWQMRVFVPFTTLLITSMASTGSASADGISPCLIVDKTKPDVNGLVGNFVNLKVYFGVVIVAAVVIGLLLHLSRIGRSLLKYGLGLFIGALFLGAIVGIVNTISQSSC